MIYVALLRGINVGGKTRVEMSRLKTLFASLGCKDISTYINSGNVIFSDERTPKELVPLIETAIVEEFGFPVRIVLRDHANIKKLCKEIPADWTNDMGQRTDVLFLWDEIDNKNILDKLKINTDIEAVRYIAGALAWTVGRENVSRGGPIKIIGTDFYKHMTIRNINTVRKLKDLMNQMRLTSR